MDGSNFLINQVDLARQTENNPDILWDNLTNICSTTSRLPLIYNSFINYCLAACRVLVSAINAHPANIRIERTP